MPRINQVPSCCGAAVIHGFALGLAYDKRHTLEYIKTKINGTYKSKDSTIIRNYSQFIIIITDKQKEHIGSDLENLGFSRVSEMRNENTNSVLHTYIFSRPSSRNTDPKVASIDKAYPPAKIVEKEVTVYALSPSQKDRFRRLKDTSQELRARLDVLEREADSLE